MYSPDLNIVGKPEVDKVNEHITINNSTAFISFDVKLMVWNICIPREHCLRHGIKVPPNVLLTSFQLQTWSVLIPMWHKVITPHVLHPFSDMGVVRGVIFDESAILTEAAADDKNASFLQPGAESILRMIFLSKIRIGISFTVNLPEPKVSHLKRVANLYSIDLFVLNDLTCEVMPTWGDIDGSYAKSK
ncbi:hypothetical protein K1719_043312 [Acacia pycnantha]|nr:hypothetical protein K1719_043312 [Acacia pycnantha]